MEPNEPSPWRLTERTLWGLTLGIWMLNDHDQLIDKVPYYGYKFFTGWPHEFPSQNQQL